MTAAPTSTATTSPRTPKPGRRDLTRQEIATRRAEKLTAVHDQLTAAVAAAASDDGWRAWLATAARFRTYSASNVLLIAAQAPWATRVAGYRVWQGLGRQVRKGERAIAVIAPVRRRATTTDDSGPAEQIAPPVPADTTDPAGKAPRVLAGFTTAAVFDITQTDGDPLPQRPPLELPEGAAPAGLWEALAAEVTARGFTVTRDDPAPAWGRTTFTTRRVDVAPGLSPAMSCHTLAHELGHIAADHATRPGLDLGTGEAEADGIAYLITTAAGMAGTFSADYITGWTHGNPAVVKATAARVVAVAGQLLDALGLTTDPAELSETPVATDADAAAV